jgi:hypothetical protein
MTPWFATNATGLPDAGAQTWTFTIFRTWLSGPPQAGSLDVDRAVSLTTPPSDARLMRKLDSYNAE